MDGETPRLEMSIHQELSGSMESYG